MVTLRILLGILVLFVIQADLLKAESDDVEINREIRRGRLSPVGPVGGIPSEAKLKADAARVQPDLKAKSVSAFVTFWHWRCWACWGGWWPNHKRCWGCWRTTVSWLPWRCNHWCFYGSFGTSWPFYHCFGCWWSIGK
ncbi:unnamed protein product [Owenia fusiformis]|uniref:Uncharacterized protein n=1 Tax=Owenia fusiformis TaxID=6347 RepID=A0A8S4NYP7_OWEFU|nr:unnamed protein product [Owenia fusiformis]